MNNDYRSVAGAGTSKHRAWQFLMLCFFAIPALAQAETALERGTYLMRGIAACGNCHTPPGGPMAGIEMAGGFTIEEEPFTAIAPNITPDPETGIGRWTDEEIIKAIREGVRPDGTIIGPPMPISLYRRMSDNDAKAIVAYLRSVPPVKNEVARSEYRMPLPPDYGPPLGQVADVPHDDPVRYGEYLAGPVGHCIECHTPFVEGHPDFANQLGAGGFPFKGPWGVSVSRNITPAPKGGLGNWSDEQIKTAITRGERPDGSKLLPPMPFSYYQNISPADLDAIVAYLRSLKPIGN